MVKNIMTKKEITLLFEYKDGDLIWKIKPSNRTNIGDIAGVIGRKYKQVQYKGKLYKVHILVWILHNGEIPNKMQVDHIDKNKLNNRIENLRLLSHSDNLLNNNAKGYYYNKRDKRYQAQIQINNKHQYIGQFKTEKEARDAYENAKEMYKEIKD